MKTNYEVNIQRFVNGKIASGRHTGNKIKNEYLGFYQSGINIDLNFSGIESVTHSFMDELIGAIVFYDAERALTRLKFLNCSEDVRGVIKFVIADRLNKNYNKILNT